MWPAGITVIEGAPPLPWSVIAGLGVLLLIGIATGAIEAYADYRLWKLRMKTYETRLQLDEARQERAGRERIDTHSERRERYVGGVHADVIRH